MKIFKKASAQDASLEDTKKIYTNFFIELTSDTARRTNMQSGRKNTYISKRNKKI